MISSLGSAEHTEEIKINESNIKFENSKNDEKICEKDGVNSINTNSGTIIRSVRQRYWTSDWIHFCEIMKENNAFDLVEQRIHQGNIKKFLEENPTIQPRGLNIDSKYSITVRRPTKK